METEHTSPTPNESFSVSRVTFNYVVIAAVFLVAGLLIGGVAFGNRTDGEALTRADVQEVVEQALSGVVLAGGGSNMDSVSLAQLEEIVREAVQQNASSASRNAGLGSNDPFLGSADAPVTIVEFSDFNCSFCTRFALETLPQIIETYGDNIRFVYRNMPILAESSTAAANAGLCAHEQGEFWTFHDYMFADMRARDRAAFIRFAEEHELDVDAFTACVDENRYGGTVTLDLIDGQGLGVRGTPAFFVNGRFISGAQPFQVFETVINAELARANGG